MFDCSDVERVQSYSILGCNKVRASGVSKPVSAAMHAMNRRCAFLQCVIPNVDEAFSTTW